MLSGDFFLCARHFIGWHAYCNTIITEKHLGGGSKNGEVGIHVF